MTKLSDIGRQIIDNRLPGGNEILYNQARKEFLDQIKSYINIEDLIQLIEYDMDKILLPLELCKEIFNRFGELNKKNVYVIKWYIFILRFLGNPSDYKVADDLENELNNF
jgi:hypothetical protein